MHCGEHTEKGQTTNFYFFRVFLIAALDFTFDNFSSIVRLTVFLKKFKGVNLQGEFHQQCFTFFSFLFFRTDDDHIITHFVLIPHF